MNPVLYLDKMQLLLKKTFGVTYPVQRICCVLLRRNFTRKVLSIIASRRCAYERSIFMRVITVHLNASQLVCIDETRKQSKDCFRLRGRGRRGDRVRMERNHHWSVWSFSALGIMSIDGMLDCAIHKVRGVTAKMFFDDCVYHVLPLMNPFPAPRSVILLDNSVLHWCTGLYELFQSNGILVQHTSAYSYDLMPIEKALSKAKAVLQRQDNDEIAANPRLALRRALMSNGPDDAAGYFRSCFGPGYVAEIAPGIYSGV